MAVDGDDSISLPQPPPPRPAARKAAIDAAMRKFDGIEDAAAKSAAAKPARKWWAGMHRRPAGALVTAVAIAVVSVPVALITLRDQPQTMAPPAREPAPTRPEQVAVPAAPPAPQVEADEIAVAEEPARPRSIPLPLAPHTDEGAPTANEEVGARQAPAPAVAAAPAPPPPPPPPPPAPAPERTEGFGGAASTQDVAVTGSRIRPPSMSKQSDARAVAEREAEPQDASATTVAYRRFLSRLQSAVRANDNRAVVRLVALPLRVNFAGGARSYSDRSAIERDYDRIFTPRVKRAILNQRADRLFTNYQGAMIGDGQIWFDQTCPNASCSPAGPVRIKAINP
ncbi:MAG TPA: hypothetical protein VFR52_07030 [Sphingomicrobium sp.]|nr:hypothetical protein [Sphingomicrobium sp.]